MSYHITFPTGFVSAERTLVELNINVISICVQLNVFSQVLLGSKLAFTEFTVKLLKVKASWKFWFPGFLLATCSRRASWFRAFRVLFNFVFLCCWCVLFPFGLSFPFVLILYNRLEFQAWKTGPDFIINLKTLEKKKKRKRKRKKRKKRKRKRKRKEKEKEKEKTFVAVCWSKAWLVGWYSCLGHSICWICRVFRRNITYRILSVVTAIVEISESLGPKDPVWHKGC